MRTLFVRKLGNVHRVPDRSPTASPNDSNKTEKTSSTKKKRKSKSNSSPSPLAEEPGAESAPVATLIETSVDNGAAVSMNGNTAKSGNIAKSVTFSLATVATTNSSTTITSTTASKYKFDDELESNYKIENYITAQQIDDMIDKRLRKAGEGALKKTAAIYDLNLIANVSHHVIVDPETGQVESIVRQECETPTTPQTFYISSPTNSLEIIEEEDDTDYGKQNISTQTEFSARNPPYPNINNLSVRCSNDSISDYSEIGTPKSIGFYDRYREMLIAEHNRSSSVEKSRSVPCLSPKTNVAVQRQMGSSATARPLSISHMSADTTTSMSASTGLSQYMNSESDSSRPTSYYSSQEEIRRLQELCGIRPANPSPRSSSWSTLSQTSSTTYESVPNRWSTSSSSDLYSVPVCKRTSSERSSVSNSSTPSTSHLTTSARSVSTDWNRYSSRSRHSTTTSTTGSDWTDATSTVSRGQAYPLQRSAYSRCINSGWSDSSKLTTSSTSSALDEVTNSLDELSRKIDAYIQKRRHAIDSGSDTGTDSTVRYVPDLSAASDGNETDYAAVTPRSHQLTGVPTLKKLALKAVLSFDRGLDLLSDIYFVPPQKSAHLNRLYTEKGLAHVHRPRYAPRHADSVPRCPRVVLSPSPSRTTRSVDSPTPDPLTLLENHQRFVNRRGYHEHQHFRQWSVSRPELAVDDLPATPRSCVLNVDENYTKELLEEAATLLAVRKYRETRPSVEPRSMANSVRERRTLESVQVQQQRRWQQQQQFINEIDQSYNNVTAGQTKINVSSTPPPPPPPQPLTPPPLQDRRSEAAATTTVAALLARQRPEKRAKSLPADYDLDIRQRMYAEYMRKVAERIERRHKKQIRICSRPLSVPNMIKIFDDGSGVAGDGDGGRSGGSSGGSSRITTLEEEFMQKARTRLTKLGIKLEELETSADDASVGVEAKTAVVEAIGSGSHLPGHLQEMIEIIDRQEEEEEEKEDDEGEFVDGCKCDMFGHIKNG